MSVDFGEIDCAHYGSWSRYVEAIRRTDELDLAAVAGGRRRCPPIAAGR